MNFRTRLDITNRQVKQYEKTDVVLSGASVFGLPYSALTSGVDLSMTGQTFEDAVLQSTYSGNTGSTVYTFGDSRMSIDEGDLVPLTPSNSGTTQFAGPTWAGYNPFTTVDGFSGYSTYSAITYDIVVGTMEDLGGGAYSGIVSSDFITYSGDSFDYSGRTIWVDVSGITRTDELIITKDTTIGYVLTCSDAEGKGTWSPVSGATSFTGNTSASCISDLWITNLHGCSPITIWDSVQSNGSSSTGTTSFGFGRLVSAFGNYSQAWGDSTTSSGYASHAEGNGTTASGSTSHAEGYFTTAGGNFSHAEGNSTLASGIYSHSEGSVTTASGQTSHAEGSNTVAGGTSSHSEGNLTKALGTSSHAEGAATTASGNAAHVEGNTSIASGTTSHAEGNVTIAGGFASHSQGSLTTASANFSHAEGSGTTASGVASHAEGIGTVASGTSSHVSGDYNIVNGDASMIGGGSLNIINYLSNNSAILGGTGNTINHSYSTILGGGGLTSVSANTTHVENFNIGLTPVNDDALTQVLVLDTDGMVRYRTASSLSSTGGTGTLRNVTTSGTILTTDDTVNITTTADTTQILPTAVGVQGKKYNIKNSDITTTSTITLNTTSSQTVDGQASGDIIFQFPDSLTVQSDGSNWIII